MFRGVIRRISELKEKSRGCVNAEALVKQRVKVSLYPLLYLCRNVAINTPARKLARTSAPQRTLSTVISASGMKIRVIQIPSPAERNTVAIMAHSMGHFFAPIFPTSFLKERFSSLILSHYQSVAKVTMGWCELPQIDKNSKFGVD